MQAFLTRLLTVDLPALMVLPKRLEINIPPGLTSVAEAAVGRDAVMRAVASAVLQSDALEHSLIAALPLGPQSPAGGITLPDSFKVPVGWRHQHDLQHQKHCAVDCQSLSCRLFLFFQEHRQKICGEVSS